jgi:hypothetical protein
MGKKKMCHDGLLQEKRRWPAVALSGGCCSALLGNTARGRRTGGCLAQAFGAGRRQREERWAAVGRKRELLRAEEGGLAKAASEEAVPFQWRDGERWRR